MERYYTDKGFISKGATLNIKDTDNKYFMLLPVVDMPETYTAPATQDKTVLSDATVTQAEGLQSVDQKTYTFNYHRDNIRQLKKYKGKSLEFIERNPDNTGEKYTGTLSYGRSGLSVDGIVQGSIYITVNSAEADTLDDVRDLIKPTAIITTPLPDVTVAVGEDFVLALETSPSATVTATSAGTSIATATYTSSSNQLKITGVAKGVTFINLETSAENEATSYRSIAVEVIPAD